MCSARNAFKVMGARFLRGLSLFMIFLCRVRIEWYLLWSHRLSTDVFVTPQITGIQMGSMSLMITTKMQLLPAVLLLVNRLSQMD